MRQNELTITLRIIIDRVQIEQTQFSESQAKYYVRYQEYISRQDDYDPEPQTSSQYNHSSMGKLG